MSGLPASYKSPAKSISETTTIEYNRWLVENEHKEEATQRKRDHDDERKLRAEMTQMYKASGKDHVDEYKEQMGVAKAEVENYHNENLRRGKDVKEEVQMLRRARKNQAESWMEHGSQLSREYGSEQKRRIQAAGGDMSMRKGGNAKAVREEVGELERVRTERQQKELADAQKLKQQIMAATSDAVTQEAKNFSYEQRKAVGDTTRDSMKTWKDSRSQQKEQYASKAAKAKAEALAAKKAAKEALDAVRDARKKAAEEMRQKRNNIEINSGKVKGDLGRTKKVVHDMTKTRKYVSPAAAELMRQRKGLEPSTGE